MIIERAMESKFPFNGTKRSMADKITMASGETGLVFKSEKNVTSAVQNKRLYSKTFDTCFMQSSKSIAYQKSQVSNGFFKSI